MARYTLNDVTIPRDFYLMPDIAKGHIVEYELYELISQLRSLPLSSRQIFELLAGTLFAHDMRQAHNFIDAMHLVLDNFRKDKSVRVAKTRHMWLAGFGINKMREATRFSQAVVYESLLKWEEAIERGWCITHLVPFVADEQFIINLDKLLEGMKTFSYQSVRLGAPDTLLQNKKKPEEERSKWKPDFLQ